MSRPQRRRRRRNVRVHCFKTEEEFAEEYRQCDFNSARKFHFKVLDEVLQAVASSDVDEFNKLCRRIHCINNLTNTEILQAHYNHADNPVKCNIIILACKENKHEILEEVFQNENILKDFANTIGKKKILPEDEDNEHHTAFYYVIRSGNVKLLDTLVNKWPGGHAPDNLDKLLSSAYEELKLKNVKISHQIMTFTESTLLNLRFWCDNQTISNCQNVSKTDVIDRVTFFHKNIQFLLVKYINREVDEAFLLTAKSIAHNMHILKNQLKVTYDKLPWEEVEFLLLVFIMCMTKCGKEHFINRISVNKDKVLLYLDHFARTLCVEVDRIQNTNVKKLLEIPKLKRDVVVEHIKENSSVFESLYTDYNIIRDSNSLETMKKYIDLAFSADSASTEGQLIIIRTLQVIGEHLKNTLQSPHLSHNTSELLICTLTRSTRMILIKLRDTLSHSHSLYARMQIERSKIDFFNGIQNDLKKLGVVITDILFKIYISAIRQQLQRIIDSSKVEEMLQIQEIFSGIDFQRMQIISIGVKRVDISDIEKQVIELSNLVNDQTYYERYLLQKIFQIIETEKSRSKNVETDFLKGFITLQLFNHALNTGVIDSNVMRIIKFMSKTILKCFQPEINLFSSERILDLSNKFLTSVVPRLPSNVADQFSIVVYKIFSVLECGLGDITCLGEILHKLNKNQYDANEDIKTETKFYTQIKQNVAALKDLLPSNVSEKEPTQEHSLCVNETLLAIEMLLLDILSILGENKKCLMDNHLFLDETFPLLIGKSLRNHLAHDNAIINTLCCDYSTVLLANAAMFCNEKVLTDEKKIGKIVVCNITKLQAKYERDLVIINNQAYMFKALVEGKLHDVMSSIADGADINARSLDMWTALHYAAKSSSVECVKFVLDQNIAVDLKNSDGQSALHIATKYGQTNVVKYLVKEKSVNVNETDNSERTCLHLAVQYGYRDIVLLLLKNQADIRKQDLFHRSPMHFAVLNNQINIVKILLEKLSVEDTHYGGYTLLHMASECGFLEIVTLLLNMEANVNARNDNLGIPLHTAALNGHVEVVKALLSNGSDIDIRSINGCTPLHYAIENGHVEVVEVLLNYGADVNFADNSYNRTPLSCAAENGNIQIIQMLLQQSADINIASVHGTTVLHFAAMKGTVEIVDQLVRTGALVNAADKSGCTALHYSSANGHTDVVKYLIERSANINAQDIFNKTPLYLAAENGKLDVVDKLLCEGADINVIGSDGNTSLHCCCVQGHINTIRVFIKHGADLEKKNKNGMTPLHLAVSSGIWGAVEALIDAGADVHSSNIMGLSALHVAATRGHKEVTEGLIDNGINVNICGTNGVIPLHLAVIGNHLPVVEILIAHGSEIDPVSSMELSSDLESIPNITRTLKNNLDTMVQADLSCVQSLLLEESDELKLPTYRSNTEIKSYTPLYLAIQNNNKGIVSYLLSKGANVNIENCVLLAIFSGFKDIAKLLINHRQFNVNTTNTNDFTLLHIAALKGHSPIVEALLLKRAQVDSDSCISKCTPLHLASRKGHYVVVKTLVDHGANVDVQTESGATALHLAATGGHEKIVQLLVQSNAKCNIQDSKFRTPVEQATAYGHILIVQKLLDTQEVNINDKGSNNFTLLHIAAQKGNIELTKFLSNKGADLNYQNNAGSKPIHIAARNGHTNIVEFFLRKNMNVDADADGVAGGSLLHCAAEGGQVEVVRLLLDNKANPNIQNVFGSTPIHIAAQFGFMNVVKVLLENGAFFNAVDQHNCTALHVAKSNDITDLLKSCEQLFHAVKKNDPLEVKLCIKDGLINIKNRSNETLLLHAVWKGYDSVVDVLLRSDADSNVTGKNNCTPLHYACKFSHVKIVIALLSSGAIYNTKTCAQKTPLSFAVNEEIVGLLKFIGEAFNNVQNCNLKVINDLENLTDSVTMKVMLNVRNDRNQTLLVCAVHCDFPKLKKLKEILQGDISTHKLLAKALCVREKFEKAEEVLEKGLEKAKDACGKDNPSLFDTQLELGKMFYKQQKYLKALNIFHDIYEKQAKLFGVHNADAQRTRSSIALVLHRQGKNEEALTMFQEVLQTQKQILGENDNDVIDTQTHMALVLMQLQKNEEALNINHDILEKRKILGSSHPVVLCVENNIAIVLNNLGKHNESLKLYKKVYEGRRRVLGDAHSDTLRTFSNMGDVFLVQKQYEEALEIWRQVLKTQKQVLPPNHIDIVNTQRRIGSLYFEQGNLLFAWKILKEVRGNLLSLLGPAHQQILYIDVMIQTVNMKFESGLYGNFKMLSVAEEQLLLAAASGEKKTVEILILCGFDVNSRDCNGRTALHCAAANGHKDTVVILLENGADCLLVSSDKGNTALHLAASKGYKDSVEVLLQHVKKVQSAKLDYFINAGTSILGNTALHVATDKGTINLLLRYGANLKIKNKNGKTPLDLGKTMA